MSYYFIEYSMLYITTCILSYYCCYFIDLRKNIKMIISNHIIFYMKQIFLHMIQVIQIYLMLIIMIIITKIQKRIKKVKFFIIWKKKQIRYLYIVNIFCAFVEILFTVTKNFILHEYYLENDFKTIPNSTSGDIIYYIYLIVYFLNVSVYYLRFYYFIIHQYSRTKKCVKKPEKKVLHENFIEKQEDIKKVIIRKLMHFCSIIVLLPKIKMRVMLQLLLKWMILII